MTMDKREQLVCCPGRIFSTTALIIIPAVGKVNIFYQGRPLKFLG